MAAEGFRETFTKDKAKARQLLYDTSAFHFVVAATLLYGGLALSYRYIRRWFLLSKRRRRLNKAFKRQEIAVEKRAGEKVIVNKIHHYCGCSACASSRLSHEKLMKQEASQRFSQPRFIGETALLIGLWLLFLFSVRNLTSIDSIREFDPFEILGVSTEASPKDIKKAYRILSLKYHPDKSRNDAEASAKYELIQKAHEVLTVPEAKANYEKFGNPEGNSGMNIGIGLPTWLVEEQNQLFVIVAFYSVILIVVPAVMYLLYRNVKKYTASGIRLETSQMLAAYVTDGMAPVELVQFVCLSAESREMPYSPAIDDKESEQLEKKLRQEHDTTHNQTVIAILDNLHDFKTAPIVKRNALLLVAHCLRRHALLSPLQADHLRDLLKSCHRVLSFLMELALLNGWYNLVQALIQTNRCLVQALDPLLPHPLLQVPNLTRDEVDTFMSYVVSSSQNLPDAEVHKNGLIIDKQGSGNVRIVDVGALLRSIDDASARQINEACAGKSFMSKLADLREFSKFVPSIELKAEASVKGENCICLGDLLTIDVTLTRNHIPAASTSKNKVLVEHHQGNVHAPHYTAEPIHENWFIFATEKTSRSLIGFQMVNNQSRTVEVSLKHLVRQIGVHQVMVIAMCDSYLAADAGCMVEYKVIHPQQADRGDYTVHPEDLEIDLRPTLYQQLQGAVATQVEEEEEEEEEPDDKNDADNSNDSE